MHISYPIECPVPPFSFIRSCVTILPLSQVESVNGSCNYYTVLETQQGSIIVTEILEGGEVSWIQNPNNLEDRNSLAKLLFQVDCKEGILVKHIMEMQQTGSWPRYLFHVFFLARHWLDTANSGICSPFRGLSGPMESAPRQLEESQAL